MDALIKTVGAYNFPANLFDFANNERIEFADYRLLESFINRELHSHDTKKVKDGLSNVLYWGYGRIPYGKVRVERFRNKITDEQLEAFKVLIANKTYSCLTIKALCMPEYSGLAFISKILMFLNPRKYVTLDEKIMRLSDESNLDSPLTKISFGPKEKTIRITRFSQVHYMDWCLLCERIADKYFEDKIAADIERGFFKLVDDKNLEEAKKIIKSTMA